MGLDTMPGAMSGHPSLGRQRSAARSFYFQNGTAELEFPPIVPGRIANRKSRHRFGFAITDNEPIAAHHVEASIELGRWWESAIRESTALKSLEDLIWVTLRGVI